MAVLAVVQSAAVSTAQPTWGELLEATTADAVGETASLHVSHIDAFAVDGGDAVLQPGTEDEEAFSYDSVDTEEGLLVGLTRPSPLDHPEGAPVQVVTQEEPSPSPSPSPSETTESDAATDADTAETSAVDDSNPQSTSQSAAVIDPCDGAFDNDCVSEVTERVGENVDCTGTAEDPVGCDVTSPVECDGEARMAFDDSCIEEVESTLCSSIRLLCMWPPPPPNADEIHLIEGPGYEYGGKISLELGANEIPEAALPGELNVFSLSPGLPIDPENPLDNSRSTATDSTSSRYCTFTSTSYREGEVGEGDDGLSAADDELGAHTATRASSGPFIVSSSYRESNAWTRAGVAATFRVKGRYTASINVTFPWNALGEMSIDEGNGRAAGGVADLKVGVMDVTSCPEGATTTRGCGSMIVYQKVKGYNKDNAGITPYGPDEGRNEFTVTVANRHTYVFFVEMETMSWAEGNSASPSTGNAFVDFYGGPHRGWLDWVKLRSNEQKFSTCG